MTATTCASCGAPVQTKKQAWVLYRFSDEIDYLDYATIQSTNDYAWHGLDGRYIGRGDIFDTFEEAFTAAMHEFGVREEILHEEREHFTERAQDKQRQVIAAMIKEKA